MLACGLCTQQPGMPDKRSEQYRLDAAGCFPPKPQSEFRQSIGNSFVRQPRREIQRCWWISLRVKNQGIDLFDSRTGLLSTGAKSLYIQCSLTKWASLEASAPNM